MGKFFPWPVLCVSALYLTSLWADDLEICFYEEEETICRAQTFPLLEPDPIHRNLMTRMRVCTQDGLRRVSAFYSHTFSHTLSHGVPTHTHTAR